MAKGQMRSNKEAKKPKQVKAKPSAEPSTLTARVNAAPDRGKKK